MCLLGAAQELVGPRQPGARIGLVRGDRNDHPRDPVAVRPALLGRADRHRDERHERVVRQLPALEQPLPHCSSAERDDNVVHRRPRLLLHPLDGFERQRAEREAPVLRDPSVEARAWRPRSGDLQDAAVRLGAEQAPDARHAAGERRHARERVRAGQVEHVRQRARDRAQRADRLAREAEHPAAEHLEVARYALRAPVGRRRDLPALGALVQQHGQDLVPRDAVDDGMVDLRQQRDAAVRQAVDDVELPQRPRPVGRAGEDARDCLGDLAVVPRGRERGLPDVEVQVEVGVLDPVGQVQPERDAHEPPVERRQEMKPLFDEPRDLLDAEPAARGGDGVVDREPSDMAEGPSGLHCQELRVEARQLPHPLSPLPRDQGPIGRFSRMGGGTRREGRR